MSHVQHVLFRLSLASKQQEIVRSASLNLINANGIEILRAVNAYPRHVLIDLELQVTLSCRSVLRQMHIIGGRLRVWLEERFVVTRTGGTVFRGLEPS